MPSAFPRRLCRALGATVAALALVTPQAARAQATVAAVLPSTGGEPWTPGDLIRLDADLDRLLATEVSLRGAHVGVLAIETASGKVLYAHAADDAFQPASTLKLLVGSAALERLGPAYRFHTQLETIAAEPGADTAKSSDLLLRAGGDPFLARGDFDEAAVAVAAAGIARVPRTYVDDSHDDAEPYAPGWTWDDFAYDYAARVSAMTFDENVVRIDVSPGSAAGIPAIARTEFPVQAENGVSSSAQTGAAGTPSTLDLRAGGSECLEAIGSIPLGGETETLDGAVCDPLRFARSALVRSLRARDIVAADAADDDVRRTGPGVRVVWQHDSAALGTWLGPRFWIPSDNLVGELLLKELGFAEGGAPGSDDKGIAFESAWLRSIGVDPATVTLADGSGLSQYDRITPRDLVAILQHDWNGPNRRLVLDSLPIGGARGTIEGIARTAAAGRVFAKTGSMMHVRGLAGYLATRRHGAVTFAFNVDDWLGDYPALAALRARALSRIVGD